MCAVLYKGLQWLFHLFHNCQDDITTCCCYLEQDVHYIACITVIWTSCVHTILCMQCIGKHTAVWMAVVAIQNPGIQE